MAAGRRVGTLFGLAGEPVEWNTRLGRALVLFGLLSVVGGVGLFVLAGTSRFDPAAVRTYRRIAVGIVGYGLPVFLCGLVVVEDGSVRAVEVAAVGVLLSTLAVVALLAVYPERWSPTAGPVGPMGAAAVYGLGTLLCAAAAYATMLTGPARDGERGADDESEFVWGKPPGG
jgi:hypothetical protein